jgi:hypothetical protein
LTAIRSPTRTGERIAILGVIKAGCKSCGFREMLKRRCSLSDLFAGLSREFQRQVDWANFSRKPLFLLRRLFNNDGLPWERAV